MTIAEIRGKISEAGTNISERMEDLLTSDIFGCLRYVPVEKVLIPFLRTAYSFHGSGFTVPDRIIRIHYRFWPRLKSSGRVPCEADVVLGLETGSHHIHLVMIEAKYYSGLSSEEGERPEPNNQLARELDNLDVASCATFGWQRGLDVASRTLLFVTQDMGIPRELLRQSLAEYSQKRKKDGDIFWASWRFLPSILEQSLEKENNPEYAAVMEDMLRLLLRKGLIMFNGVEQITELFEILDFYPSALTRYAWPRIAEPICIDYKYEVAR